MQTQQIGQTKWTAAVRGFSKNSDLKTFPKTKTTERFTAQCPVCLFSATPTLTVFCELSQPAERASSATPADWEVELLSVQSSKSHVCAGGAAVRKGGWGGEWVVTPSKTCTFTRFCPSTRRPTFLNMPCFPFGGY